MRPIAYTALAGLFVCLVVLGAVTPPVEVGVHDGSHDDPWPVYNSPTVALAWDAEPYTAAGSEVVSADIQLLTETGEVVEDFQARQGAVLKEGSVYKVHVRSVFEGKDNNFYVMRVRVYDAHGNASDWSAPITVQKNWKSLPTPGCWMSI